MNDQQWLVSVDGVDAPGVLTELVTDSVTAAVSSGSRVCIRQPIDAGVLSRIQDNPGGETQGISSIDPFAIVYVKDLCYTLREVDFRSLGSLMFAEVRFKLLL
jgi:hypothetical protein